MARRIKTRKKTQDPQDPQNPRRLLFPGGTGDIMDNQNPQLTRDERGFFEIPQNVDPYQALSDSLATRGFDMSTMGEQRALYERNAQGTPTGKQFFTYGPRRPAPGIGVDRDPTLYTTESMGSRPGPLPLNEEGAVIRMLRSRGKKKKKG